MAGNAWGAGPRTGVSARHFRRPGLTLLAGLAALALAGCEQAGTAAGGGSVMDRPAQGRAVERDVEAPEVFQVADQGLWDGRPSLGGVWIAHADVDDPERVMIRNEATGEFVVGALFRRERENPGPRLQVSSDAAAALGMLAGQPVELSVVALRREESAPEPPAAAPEPQDVVEEAPTALAEAPAPDPTDEPAAEAPVEAASDASEARAGGFAALFRRRAPTPEVPAETVVAGVETAPIETQALANVTATAASAIERAETAAPAAAPSGARSVSAPGAPDRPYVQIGIFSVEGNADRAAGMLREGGHAAEIRREVTSGRSYWRVLAGPATTGVERDRLIAAVRGLGFADAYAVRR
jgi:hypothetical protein